SPQAIDGDHLPAYRMNDPTSDWPRPQQRSLLTLVRPVVVRARCRLLAAMTMTEMRKAVRMIGFDSINRDSLALTSEVCRLFARTLEESPKVRQPDQDPLTATA